MIHEVLVQLISYNGRSLDIISNLDSRANGFLHPAELEIYNKIINIASDYALLKNFCKKYRYRTEVEYNSEDQLPLGLYLQAVCEGIDLALAPYREEVLSLEKRALINPQMSLSMILTKMSSYGELIDIMKHIVATIILKQLHGCQILHLLHCELSNGSETKSKAVKIVFQQAQNILYIHLTNWLLNGELNDVYKEFFIEKIQIPEQSDTKDSSDISVDTILMDVSMPSLHLEYQINTDLLPQYMSTGLASKILFIGRTILMFKSDPRRNKMSVWGDMENEYHHKLSLIQQEGEFNTTILENAIEQIKSFVTQHLFELIVEDADLLHQLTLMKDYFFLGRGELFLEFIKLSTKLLNELPSKNANGTRDLNVAFILATRNMFIGEEAEAFRFTLPYDKKKNESMDCELFENLPASPAGLENLELDGWSLLTMKYNMKWPLYLLFTPTVMERYNILFRFLLKVKKTQLELHQIWSGQRSETRIYSNPRIWQLRHQLIFLIEHLQYYLQVDVVESQSSILHNTIKNTRDFEAIQRAHSVFLSNIMSQCFLLMGPVEHFHGPSKTLSAFGVNDDNPVFKILNKVFELCDRFCSYAPVWGRKRILSVADLEDLDNIDTSFSVLMDALLKLLAALRTQPCGAHLSQLILRLDFNRWFSVQKHKTDSSDACSQTDDEFLEI